MNNQEAIRRIKDHMRIHYKLEYPRAIKITEALNTAISALEAQQVDMWIPITWLYEETYPEPFKEVIFTDGDYIYIGCCDSDGKWTSTNQENSINVYDVKAWKPLPEPYKEEQP